MFINKLFPYVIDCKRNPQNPTISHLTKKCKTALKQPAMGVSRHRLNAAQVRTGYGPTLNVYAFGTE